MVKEKIGVIKIDPDEIRQNLINNGCSGYHVWSQSCKIIKSLVDLYSSWDFKFIIFFGAPGSGKSHFIKNNRFKAGTVVLETSGIHAPLNKILKGIPGATFLQVKAMSELCKKRIKSRHKEFGKSFLDTIVKSVDRFNKMYNEPVRKDWLLKEDNVVYTDERCPKCQARLVNTVPQ